MYVHVVWGKNLRFWNVDMSTDLVSIIEVIIDVCCYVRACSVKFNNIAVSKNGW
jgi:hypothetical protein